MRLPSNGRRSKLQSVLRRVSLGVVLVLLGGTFPVGLASAEPEETTPKPKPEEDPLVRERRQKESAQAARETAQPREPLADVSLPEPPKWERRLEVGASFAFVLRPFADALAPTDIGYQPAPGFAVHLHWPVFSWLRFHPYFIHAFHSIDLPQGGLQSGTSISISPDATVSDASVATFVLGAKIAPPSNSRTDGADGSVPASVGDASSSPR